MSKGTQTYWTWHNPIGGKDKEGLYIVNGNADRDRAVALAMANGHGDLYEVTVTRYERGLHFDQVFELPVVTEAAVSVKLDGETWTVEEAGDGGA